MVLGSRELRGASLTSAHDELKDITSGQHHQALKPFIHDGGNAHYSIPGWGDSGTHTANTLVADHLYMLPIYVERSTAFVRLALHVNTAGAAGTVARMGIYAAKFDSSGQLLAGALVLDAGTVVTDSTGQKDITITQTLVAGFHFLALSSDGTPVLLAVDFAGGSNAPVTSAIPTITGEPGLVPGAIITDGAATFPDPAPTPTLVFNARNAQVWLRT